MPRPPASLCRSRSATYATSASSNASSPTLRGVRPFRSQTMSISTRDASCCSRLRPRLSTTSCTSRRCASTAHSRPSRSWSPPKRCSAHGARVGGRRRPAPLLGEATLVLRVPRVRLRAHLGHREPDPAARDPDRGDPNGRHPCPAQPLEVVVVLEERALEALVERSDALDHLARGDPEGAVEAAGLDPGLPLDDRARDDAREAEVVHVSVDHPRVVPEHGENVARSETQPEVPVPREPGALVHDHELLA